MDGALCHWLQEEGEKSSVDPILEKQIEMIRNLVDSYMGIGLLCVHVAPCVT